MKDKVLYIEKIFGSFKETYVIEKNNSDYECSYEIKSGEQIFHSTDCKYVIDETVYKEFLSEIEKIYNKKGNKILLDNSNKYNFIINIPDLEINISGEDVENSFTAELTNYVKENFVYLSKQYDGNILSNNITFKLKTNDDTYSLTLKKEDEISASLSYVKKSELSTLSVGDLVEYIPVDKYNLFVEKIKNITNNWKSVYNAETDKNIWELSISTDNYKFFVEGTGGYPENWNQLIDLVVEYELIFKKLKKKDDRSVLIKYFKEELNVFNQDVEHFINELFDKHKDIFNEFIKSLEQKTYDFLYPIEVDGFTAKKLNEIQSESTTAEIYYTLLMLTLGFEETTDIISDFKTRTKKCEIELQKDIELEVDKIMLEQGIITENDIGKNVSVLGKANICENVKKRMLKERFNIDYKTFNERHPDIMID